MARNSHLFYTPRGRVWAENLLVPDLPENRKAHKQYAKGQYKVTLFFDKSDQEVRTFVKEFVTVGANLLRTTFPTLKNAGTDEIMAIIRRRLRDGDEMVEAYRRKAAAVPDVVVPTALAGHWVISATSKTQPACLDITEGGQSKPLTPKACYRGMYGHAEIAVGPVDAGGQFHLAAWLNAFVKTQDGGHIGRRGNTTALLSHIQKTASSPNDVPRDEFEI